MDKPYTIEVVDRVSVVRFAKTPTESETIDAFEDVLAIENSDMRLWIFQFGLNFTTEEIIRLSEYAKGKVSLPSKLAIVVPDDFSFGLARMHDVYREQEGVDVRIFRDEQQAVAWLKGENLEKPGS